VACQKIINGHAQKINRHAQTIVSRPRAGYIGNNRSNRPVWVIHSAYTEGDKTYKFHSEAIFFDLPEVLNRNNINTIPVWVDPADMTKYYMPVDQLKELAEKAKTGSP
jgi:hypothetical protein